MHIQSAGRHQRISRPPFNWWKNIFGRSVSWCGIRARSLPIICEATGEAFGWHLTADSRLAALSSTHWLRYPEAVKSNVCTFGLLTDDSVCRTDCLELL